MQQLIEQTWNQAIRVNYLNESLYKMKLLKNNQFMMHLPKLKIIQLFDLQLNPIQIKYQFSAEVQAIQNIKFQNEQYMAAGTRKGIIELISLDNQQKYKLQIKGNNSSPFNLGYINDILHLGHGRLINCYNNGLLAIWDISKNLTNDLQPISEKKVHSSFTYKIRALDEETILSCSNDKTAKLYDIETSTVIDSFLHQHPIWCAYPLNESVFCSGGLSNRILFWDIRIHRIIQKCILQHQETSFITRLNSNNLILGDGPDLLTCDLRKPIKQLFGNKKMKVSAQSILVTGKQVIATGRGGDLRLFRKGQQSMPIQRNIGQAQEEIPIWRRLNLLFPNLHLNFRNLDDSSSESDQEVELQEEDELQNLNEEEQLEEQDLHEDYLQYPAQVQQNDDEGEDQQQEQIKGQNNLEIESQKQQQKQEKINIQKQIKQLKPSSQLKLNDSPLQKKDQKLQQSDTKIKLTQIQQLKQQSVDSIDKESFNPHKQQILYPSSSN